MSLCRRGAILYHAWVVLQGLPCQGTAGQREQHGVMLQGAPLTGRRGTISMHDIFKLTCKLYNTRVHI
jgi:hypothetical protein